MLAQAIEECLWAVYHVSQMALKELPVLRQRGVCRALPDVDPDWADQTATLMKALADPTRLTMIAALWKAKAPICICDFTADLSLSQPTISHHMAKLKEAGLVDAEKDGIWMYYRLSQGLAPGARRILAQLISSMNLVSHRAFSSAGAAERTS